MNRNDGKNRQVRVTKLSEQTDDSDLQNTTAEERWAMMWQLASLWALAYVEELFWHRGVWHEKNWLFGANWDWTNFKTFLVPLLAVPQLTHYVLDGFIWRRKSNANFRLID